MEEDYKNTLKEYNLNKLIVYKKIKLILNRLKVIVLEI